MTEKKGTWGKMCLERNSKSSRKPLRGRDSKVQANLVKKRWLEVAPMKTVKAWSK